MDSTLQAPAHGAGGGGVAVGVVAGSVTANVAGDVAGNVAANLAANVAANTAGNAAENMAGKVTSGGMDTGSAVRSGLGPLAARWGAGAVSLAACLLAWQWAASSHLDLGLVTFQNVPPPTEVAAAAWTLLQSPQLLGHLKASVARVFSGFVVAALVGIALGLAIGRSRRLESWLMPPLEMLRPIPAVAWIPLAILMFPSSELSMVFITFTGALFPILLNTVHGVENIDPRLVASARSLGGGRRAVFTEVVLPGAAPSIVTGLSIGMGTAWFCLVTAEMISGQFGIGYYTWASYTIQNYADIVVGMLVIGLLGMGSSALVKTIGQVLMPWHQPEGKP